MSDYCYTSYYWTAMSGYCSKMIIFTLTESNYSVHVNIPSDSMSSEKTG